MKKETKVFLMYKNIYVLKKNVFNIKRLTRLFSFKSALLILENQGLIPGLYQIEGHFDIQNICMDVDFHLSGGNFPFACLYF